MKTWLIAIISRILNPGARDAQMVRMQELLTASAAQNLELARKFQELQRRLVHHERGPLKASAEQLNNQRRGGLILPASVRQ
jgi:hypothetical protein